MRSELTEYEWAGIRPMLPNKPRGVPRVDDRCVRDACFGCCGRVHRGANYRRTSAPIRLLKSLRSMAEGWRLDQIMNAMAASYDAVVRYVNRGRATALGLRPTTSPLPTRIMRDGAEPRAFVRSDPEAKPEAFILATQNAVGPAPAFARYEGCLILDRRLFSARGARHARPCGRPPMRVRDCAKSCALWD
jgi:hypothetical protein